MPDFLPVYALALHFWVSEFHSFFLLQIYSIRELLRCRKSLELKALKAEASHKKKHFDHFCCWESIVENLDFEVSYKQFLILHEFNLCQIFYLFMLWHSTSTRLNSTKKKSQHPRHHVQDMPLLASSFSLESWKISPRLRSIRLGWETTVKGQSFMS